MMAHELCRAGIECCVIDKRSIATGNSVASTVSLQYKIQGDAYRAATGLPTHDIKEKRLNVFTHTDIKEYNGITFSMIGHK